MASKGKEEDAKDKKKVKLGDDFDLAAYAEVSEEKGEKGKKLLCSFARRPRMFSPAGSCTRGMPR